MEEINYKLCPCILKHVSGTYRGKNNISSPFRALQHSLKVNMPDVQVRERCSSIKDTDVIKQVFREKDIYHLTLSVLIVMQVQSLIKNYCLYIFHINLAQTKKK